MPQEDKLIRLLSRLQLDAAAIGRLNGLFKENLDWDYILKQSVKEGVSCLIYQHLKKAPFKDYLPRGILGPLENIYYNNAKRNALIYAESERVLDALKAAKIKTIILKGLFLAENVYQNVALRPMNDIDLLIRKEDLLRASEILGSLGYRAEIDCQTALRLPFSYSLNFFYRNTDEVHFLSIDLHWHFLSSTWLMGLLAERIDMERIWSQAEAAMKDGGSAFNLSPAHFLLYLAQHGFTHSFDRLIMLTDIVETLSYYDHRIIWDELREEAAALKLSNLLSYCLYLTFDRLGRGLPEGETVGLIERGLKKDIFSFLRQVHLSPCLQYLILENRLGDRIRFLAKAFYLSAYLKAPFLQRRFKA